MIPNNPYLFAALTLFLALAPVITAGAPGVELPPWLPYLVGILSAGCAVLLKLMLPGATAQTQGTEVDTLIDRLEALPKDERNELSARLEWRAKLRGEGDR